MGSGNAPTVGALNEIFYRRLAKADPIQHSRGRSQLVAKLAIPDETCCYISRNVDGASANTLKVYKLDNTYIRCVEDIKNSSFGASMRGAVKGLLLDPRSRNVRSAEGSSRVADIWLSALQGMPMLSPMVRCPSRRPVLSLVQACWSPQEAGKSSTWN